MQLRLGISILKYIVVGYYVLYAIYLVSFHFSHWRKSENSWVKITAMRGVRKQCEIRVTLQIGNNGYWNYITCSYSIFKLLPFTFPSFFFLRFEYHLVDFSHFHFVLMSSASSDHLWHISTRHIIHLFYECLFKYMVLFIPCFSSPFFSLCALSNFKYELGKK